MEFLDFNLDIIQYIYDKLTPLSAVMLASTCSSLVSYYPYEAKHRKLMERALADINLIDYNINTTLESDTYIDGVSGRSKSDCTVIYMYERGILYDYSNLLLIKYCFTTRSHPQDAIDYTYDGGYPNVNKFRKFRTFIDRTMWRVEHDHNVFASLHRRHILGGTHFRVEIDGDTFIIF